MKNLLSLYRRFPLAGLLLAGVGICIWVFSVVFLIVLLTVAFTA
jgi:hypothetical protein